MGRHSAQPAWSRRPILLAGGALLLVAVGAFAVTRAAASDVPEPGTAEARLANAAPARSTPNTPTQAPRMAAGSALLAECVTRQTAAQPVVAAASQGAAHWSQHVQGQSDIEAGLRTKIEVKVNTWAPTRAAGPADVAAYDSAQAAYAGVTGCAGTVPAEAAGEVKAKLAACLERQQKLDAYLGAASAVMTDWRAHLIQMGQHSAGEVDSAHALDNWMIAWRNAPANLTPYAAAEAALASASACAA